MAATWNWRLLTRRTFLYTEMLTDGALLNGVRHKLLRFDRSEHPIGLQRLHGTSERIDG